MIAAPAGDGPHELRVPRRPRRRRAAVLLDDSGRFDGQALEVTGPEAITMAEAAAGAHRGHRPPGRVPRQTVEEAWATRRPSGHPDWEIEGWVTSYLAIAAGELATVTDVVPPADRAPGAHGRRAPARQPEDWAHLR